MCGLANSCLYHGPISCACYHLSIVLAHFQLWITCSFLCLHECHPPVFHFQGNNSVLFFVCGQGVCGCERFASSSIGDVFRTIIKRDGYVGLMRGWKPRMLFHAPAAAICWSTYESSKSFFERFNEKRRK